MTCSVEEIEAFIVRQRRCYQSWQKYLARFEPTFGNRMNPPERAREHQESSECWCHPTLDYSNPETGAKHWIHHEQN